MNESIPITEDFMPRGHSPNWEAAEDSIIELKLETVLTEEMIYEFSSLIDQAVAVPDDPSAPENVDYLIAVRRVLADDLALFRAALSDGHPELVVDSSRHGTFYRTLLREPDFEAESLYAAQVRLGESGILDAAGFPTT